MLESLRKIISKNTKETSKQTELAKWTLIYRMKTIISNTIIKAKLSEKWQKEKETTKLNYIKFGENKVSLRESLKDAVSVQVDISEAIHTINIDPSLLKNIPSNTNKYQINPQLNSNGKIDYNTNEKGEITILYTTWKIGAVNDSIEITFSNEESEEKTLYLIIDVNETPPPPPINEEKQQ